MTDRETVEEGGIIMAPPSSAILAAIGGKGGGLPSVADQFAGPLLIMGGAACVREDLLAIDADWPGARLAVNDIGAHYHGAIDHWVTLHPDYMAGWHRFRIGHNYGDRGHVFTHSDRPAPAIQFVWNLAHVGGSSGLFACFLGLLLGYPFLIAAILILDPAFPVERLPVLDWKELGALLIGMLGLS